MNFSGGVAKKKKPAVKPRAAIGKKSRASKSLKLPKTRKLMTRKSAKSARPKYSRANSSMSLTELQIMAKSRGIPFGGLTRARLIRKINNYY